MKILTSIQSRSGNNFCLSFLRWHCSVKGNSSIAFCDIEEASDNRRFVSPRYNISSLSRPWTFESIVPRYIFLYLVAWLLCKGLLRTENVCINKIVKNVPCIDRSVQNPWTAMPFVWLKWQIWCYSTSRTGNGKSRFYVNTWKFDNHQSIYRNIQFYSNWLYS